MSEEITINYGGIDVAYEERGDKWTFTLRGKERSASSLTLAKAAIDAPPPKDEAPFKRVECYRGDYGRYTVVVVTSATAYKDDFRYRHAGDEGRRNKGTQTGYGSQLYPVTPENTAKIEQIKALIEQKDKLAQQAESIRKSMFNLTQLVKERDEAAKKTSEVESK